MLARRRKESATASRQDGHLLVQLMSSPTAELGSDGLDLLMAYDEPPTYEQVVQEHPQGSEGMRSVNALLDFHETMGTFVKHGLLDRDLVYDLFWVSGVWERAKDIALHLREQAGNPSIYANFEQLAAAQPD